MARGLSGRMPRVSSGAESHEEWGLKKTNSLKNGAFVHFTRFKVQMPIASAWSDSFEEKL